MTDVDDDIIRLNPEGPITLGTFIADTSIGPVETPILVWTDQRFGECHLLLNPADGQAIHLTQQLVAYVQALVDVAEQEDDQ